MTESDARHLEVIAGATAWTALRITMWLNDNPILDLRQRD